MRKQVQSTKKPGKELYAKTSDQVKPKPASEKKKS